MKLHEYQSKELLEKFGVPVPRGQLATDAAMAEEIASRYNGRCVVKAQVLMGGRGKAGGVKLFENAKAAGFFAGELLGKRLVSVQNPEGMIVEKVLVGELIEIAQEYYLSVLLDRAQQKVIVMISKEGGMDIEDVAHHKPEAIVRLTVDPAWGLADFEIRDAVQQAQIPVAAQRQMVTMIKALVKAYLESDADMVEINPVAWTPDGKLIAADAKVSIDENALYRLKQYDETKDDAAGDPLEAEASRRGIAFVKLDGDIGIIGNGAGLVMCSMDEVKAAGGRPANFLDVGGGAQADRVKSCVELVMMNPDIKGLLINIFGGITRGDEVAKGILEAFSTLDVKIPVVARVEGTAADEALKLLEGSQIVGASTMQEAAKKVVELSYAT